MLLPSQRPPAVTIIFGPVSPIGPSLQMWPHTYLVAIGAIADMPDALTHTRKARMTLNRHERDNFV